MPELTTGPGRSVAVAGEVSEHAHDQQLGEGVGDSSRGGGGIGMRLVDSDRDPAGCLLGMVDERWGLAV